MIHDLHYFGSLAKVLITDNVLCDGTRISGTSSTGITAKVAQE